MWQQVRQCLSAAFLYDEKSPKDYQATAKSKEEE